MVGEGECREELSTLVSNRGLEVATVDSGDLIAHLGKEAPDAVVMDLAMSGFHGVADLLELRDDRVHTGLPVMVLTHDGLNEKERELIGEMATVHAPRAEAPATLKRLLDASFPVAESEDDHG